MKAEDFPEPHVDLWPENAPAFDLFRDFSTQWRSGPGGAYGLDFTVFFHELDRRKLSPDQYDEMMDDLRTIESAALDEIHKQ